MARRSKKEIREEAERFAIAQRRDRVIALHLQGKASRQIAAEVGVSQPTVLDDIAVSLSNYNLVNPDQIAMWRATQLADLEMIRNALAPSVESPPTVPMATREGKLVRDDDGNIIRAPLYKEQFMAADRLLKAHERMARLLGLDMPEQQQVDNHITVEIIKTVGKRGGDEDTTEL